MFSRKKPTIPALPSAPTSEVTYPMWTFAKTEKGYWLVLDKTRSPLISERAFWSWGKPFVQSSEKALGNYKVGRKVGFAPGSLLRSMDGQHWFITGAKPLETERRHITTPDFFWALGYRYENAILVSLDELTFHSEGSPISGI